MLTEQSSSPASSRMRPARPGTSGSTDPGAASSPTCLHSGGDGCEELVLLLVPLRQRPRAQLVVPRPVPLELFALLAGARARGSGEGECEPGRPRQRTFRSSSRCISRSWCCSAWIVSPCLARSAVISRVWRDREPDPRGTLLRSSPPSGGDSGVASPVAPSRSAAAGWPLWSAPPGPPAPRPLPGDSVPAASGRASRGAGGALGGVLTRAVRTGVAASDISAWRSIMAFTAQKTARKRPDHCCSSRRNSSRRRSTSRTLLRSCGGAVSVPSPHKHPGRALHACNVPPPSWPSPSAPIP